MSKHLSLCFYKKLHLRCSTRFWKCCYIFLLKNILYALREGFREGRFLRGKNQENLGINFCKCLVKHCRTNYHFYQKNSLYDLPNLFLTKKIKWLKFMFTSHVRRIVMYPLLNKRPSYLFEIFSCKFRINFY